MAVRAADVQASIWQYLSANFSAATICWPGRDWDTDALTTWVEPHILEIEEALPRRPQVLLRGILEINVFRKLGLTDSSSNNAYTATWLGDQLMALFSHKAVDVVDYVSGSGVTGTATVSFARGSLALLGRFESLEQVSFRCDWQVS